MPSHHDDSFTWHVVHPLTAVHPEICKWLDEVEAILREEFPNSKTNRIEADGRGDFELSKIVGAVHNQCGPVLGVAPLNKERFYYLRESLQNKVPVEYLENSSDSTDLYEQLQGVALSFGKGEPQLPRKFVIAILVLRKFKKHQLWGGNDKGYMWSDRIPKGRGIPEELSDGVSEVISDMLSCDLLIRKKSRGKWKYALNPGHRKEIENIIENGDFPKFQFREIRKILTKDRRTVSARFLDET